MSDLDEALEIAMRWKDEKSSWGPNKTLGILSRALLSAQTEAREKTFINAVIDIAVARQKGYAERRHGDVLNGNCMDDLVKLCGEYSKETLQREKP